GCAYVTSHRTAARAVRRLRCERVSPTRFIAHRRGFQPRNSCGDTYAPRRRAIKRSTYRAIKRSTYKTLYVMPSSALTAQLRGPGPDALVSRRRRRPVQSATPGDLHGACLDRVDRPLPALRTDDAPTCERPLRDCLRRRCQGGVGMKAYQPTGLGRSIVGFFQEYLPTLRGMSRHTIQSYRDGLVLF